MPKWLQNMVTPTLMLWLYAFAYGIASAANPDGMGLPSRADLLASIALALAISLWVTADARKRGRKLFYDYDSFIYFVWPVMVPVYLFQTRGMKAFLTLLCFAGIWLMPLLAAAATILIRNYLSS
jgi:hypothetical protein